jgi:hypothetical protein
MFHDNMIILVNSLLEKILNYLHHTVNNKMDESLNEIFNEIRMNILIHNTCLVQKYVDIIKVILGILVVIFGYTTFNLLKKTERLEDIITKYSDFVKEFGEQINVADKRLKEIDDRGLFKSDDEIGWFFEQIKVIQKSISRFKIN